MVLEQMSFTLLILEKRMTENQLVEGFCGFYHAQSNIGFFANISVSFPEKLHMT